MTDLIKEENSPKANKVVIAVAALVATGSAFLGVSQLKAGTFLQTASVSVVQQLPIPHASANIADIVEKVSPAVVSIHLSNRE